MVKELNDAKQLGKIPIGEIFLYECRRVVDFDCDEYRIGMVVPQRRQEETIQRLFAAGRQAYAPLVCNDRWPYYEPARNVFVYNKASRPRAKSVCGRSYEQIPAGHVLVSLKPPIPDCIGIIKLFAHNLEIALENARAPT